MPLPQYAGAGVTRRSPGAGIADGLEQEVRLDRYGGTWVNNIWPGMQALADEGNFFVAANATPGTGIAQQARLTSFSDTADVIFCIQNRNQLGQRVYPVYLKLFVTTVVATCTQMDFVAKIDIIDRSPATAANGTALTLVNTNGDSSNAAPGINVIAYNGNAYVAKASSASARTVGRCSIDTGVQVVLDEYVLQWGAYGLQQSRGNTAVRATDTGRFVGNMPPVGIGVGEDFTLMEWTLNGASTINAFEYEWGLVVR